MEEKNWVPDHRLNEVYDPDVQGYIGLLQQRDSAKTLTTVDVLQHLLRLDPGLFPESFGSVTAPGLEAHRRDEMAELTVDVWGCRMTPELARAFAGAYQAWLNGAAGPISTRALACCLLSDPSSGASRTLGAVVGLEHDELVTELRRAAGHRQVEVEVEAEAEVEVEVEVEVEADVEVELEVERPAESIDVREAGGDVAEGFIGDPDNHRPAFGNRIDYPWPRNRVLRRLTFGKEPKPCSCRIIGAEDQDFDGPIVVLVHGTFKPHSPWAGAGSPLADSVRAALGPNAKIDTFCWSGRNSHTARIQAGHELGMHLQYLRRLFPRGRIYLVGHSHGGNVINYCLTDPEAAAEVSAVVTLATPYIHFETDLDTTHLLGPVMIVLATAFAYVVNSQGGSVMSRLAATTLTAVIGFAFGLIVLAQIAIERGLSKRPSLDFVQDYDNAATVVDETLVNTGFGAVPSVAVRTAADEASGALIWAQFSRWLLSHVNAGVMYRMARRLKRLVLFWIFLRAAAWLARSFGLGLPGTVFDVFHTVAGLVCAYAAFVGVVFVARSAASLAIGLDGPLLALRGEPYIEGSAPGSSVVHTIRLKADDGPRLRHSLICEDEATLAYVSGWLAEREAAGRG